MEQHYDTIVRLLPTDLDLLVGQFANTALSPVLNDAPTGNITTRV